MHPGALRALDFDRVIDAVRSFAQTSLGTARLAGVRPHTDPRHAREALDMTSEGVLYLHAADAALRAADDLAQVLDALAVEAHRLEPTGLLALATFLSSVLDVRQAIRSLAPEAAPHLHAIADRVAGFEGEIAGVRHAIDDGAEVVDEASPQLRTIRERLRKQRQRLRGTLESFVRGKDARRYLQDQIVTDRNGRYVLVVRAEHRRAIPGLVHGHSASGASVYLEPLSTVELNNDIVALQDQEREEVHRILLALTDAFRHRAADLQRTVTSATDFDEIQAKARFARLVDGIAPAPAPDGRIELLAARHPLLLADVVARLDTMRGVDPAGAPPPRAAPVPIDIVMIPPVTALVITGPNTGGKTVALKTAGLLALMAQAGLHVPAAPGSRLPVFRSVFADIGDEQSIDENLSTFSGHIANIVTMDRQLKLPALVLLDEVGAGTDPREGSALGTAIVDHFRSRDARVIVTTHDDALKSFGSTTDGVACAAFGFDPESYAPTFALRYGSPGRSLALEIAGRLGMAPSVLDAARRLRGRREGQLADHLATLDRDRQAVDRDRVNLERERKRVAAATAELNAREAEIRDRAQTSRRQEHEAVDRRIREAKREIDAVMSDLRARSEALAREAARRPAPLGPPRLSTGQQGEARRQARDALAAIADRLGPPAEGSTAPVVESPPGKQPAIGDLVDIRPLGLRGRLRDMRGQEAEVEAEGKRLRVDLSTLRVVAGGGTADRGTVDVTVRLQPRADSSSSELNVIGCRVEEAVARVEKFLDGALLAELRSVRVIHGHGTGRLRSAIAEALKGHSLVARVSPAPAEQGGNGVTVVELSG